MTLQFKGYDPRVHISLAAALHTRIQDLVNTKKYQSIQKFLKEAAGMALFIFYDVDTNEGDIPPQVDTLLGQKEFTSASSFYDFAARWKLIQVKHYPNIDRIAYTLRNWFGGNVS